MLRTCNHSRSANCLRPFTSDSCSSVFMTQPAGTPVVRFGDGIQLQQSGRAARLPATMNVQQLATAATPVPHIPTHRSSFAQQQHVHYTLAGRNHPAYHALGWQQAAAATAEAAAAAADVQQNPFPRSHFARQLLSQSTQARPTPILQRQDAMANDTVRSPIPAKSEEEGFTTTPPCSPSPRSSKDLISEPSTPFSGPRPQPTREEMSVERSTSSTSDEDYVVDSSEEEEAMKSPHYSPRGHHDPPSPTPSPSPAVKMTKKEHNRSYYELNKERLRVENRWRAAARREKKREVRKHLLLICCFH